MNGSFSIHTVMFFAGAGVVFFVLTMLAFMDAINKEFKTFKIKVAWCLISLIPFFGFFIYLIFGWRKGKKPEQIVPSAKNNI